MEEQAEQPSEYRGEDTEHTEDTAPRRGRFLGEVWEIAKVLLISAAVVLPIRYFIAQPFIVRGASMEPSFEDREYLIIDEISYYLRLPRRGEPVVFRYPKDRSQFFIKRIIGLPGDRVEIRNGKIKIFNAAYPEGFTLDEEYLNPPDRPTRPDYSVTLGKEQYVVLGDNRDFSSDSRVWGPLDRAFLVGRAVFRAWPADRFGAIPHSALDF